MFRLPENNCNPTLFSSNTSWYELSLHLKYALLKRRHPIKWLNETPKGSRAVLENGLCSSLELAQYVCLGVEAPWILNQLYSPTGQLPFRYCPTQCSLRFIDKVGVYSTSTYAHKRQLENNLISRSMNWVDSYLLPLLCARVRHSKSAHWLFWAFSGNLSLIPPYPTLKMCGEKVLSIEQMQSKNKRCSGRQTAINLVFRLLYSLSDIVCITPNAFGRNLTKTRQLPLYVKRAGNRILEALE